MTEQLEKPGLVRSLEALGGTGAHVVERDVLVPLRAALAEARTVLAAQDLADWAGRMQVIAAVQGLAEVEVECSLVKMDAERRIAGLVPAMPTGVHRNGGSPDYTLPKHVVRDIRNAHSRLSDEDYEALQAKARENVQPLTRAALVLAHRKVAHEASLESEMAEHQSLIEAGHAEPGSRPPRRVSAATLRREEERSLHWLSIGELKAKLEAAGREIDELRLAGLSPDEKVGEIQRLEKQIKHGNSIADDKQATIVRLEAHNRYLKRDVAALLVYIDELGGDKNILAKWAQQKREKGGYH